MKRKMERTLRFKEKAKEERNSLASKPMPKNIAQLHKFDLGLNNSSLSENHCFGLPCAAEEMFH